MGAGLNGQRILILEDEPMVAMLLEDLVEEIGATVVDVAANVRQGLELVDREAIDGALLDVNLDGEVSYPVADALAARNIPFVFITGYGRGGLSPEHQDAPIVQKPFSKNAIESALEGVLGRGSRDRQQR